MIVGLALGVRQLTQQGLGIFGGAIADPSAPSNDHHRHVLRAAVRPMAMAISRGF